MPMTQFTPEFLGALASSPTIASAVGLWGGLLLGSVIGAVLLGAFLARRLRWQGLHADTRGVAAAVDFTLTLPLFLTVVILSVQFAVMLNGAMIVHYSAFMAARSARVWIGEAAWGLPLARRVPTVTREARSRAADAARFALIAASPADPQIASGGGRVPTRILREIARSGGLPGRSDVLVRKARYAFDPRNVDVDIDLPLVRRLGAAVSSQAPPVTATVKYRQVTGVLIGRVFGRNRGDGVHYVPVTATVSLL